MGSPKEYAVRYNKKYYKRNRKREQKRSTSYRKENQEQVKEYQVRWARQRGRGYWLKINYGLSIEEYDQMFKEQNGRCKICGRHRTEQKNELSVDHNHITGQVRGLLCARCNVGLGFFENHTDEILKYLECK